MEFRILGPLEVEVNGAPMSFKGHKPRALLGLLLLHRNQPVAPEQLIELRTDLLEDEIEVPRVGSLGTWGYHD